MYVITGATGNTGSVVAEKLLAKGEKVRVIGRDANGAPHSEQAWQSLGATTPQVAQMGIMTGGCMGASHFSSAPRRTRHW